MAEENMTLEEARVLVAQAETEQAEQEAAEREALDRPFNEFKESSALAAVLENLEALRKTYIGTDEKKFAKVNALYQLITRL